MEHGIVTSVTQEDGVIYCDVRAIRVDTEYDKLPMVKTHSSFIQVPEQGETVTMEQMDDGTRLITNVLSKAGSSPDDLREGEFLMQLDDETRIYFEEQNDGSYDLHIGASGDVYINGTVQ